MGGQKKTPTFPNITKVGILKEKKRGREVGILSKTPFFPKMGTLTHKKSEYGRKITHFLKVGVKKQKKSGRKVDAHPLSKSGHQKKKRGNVDIFIF